MIIKRVIVVVLIMLSFILSGCVDKKYDDNYQDSITNRDNEEILLNSSVNIYTSSGDFGAGFVYDDGYIITNYHVVFDSKDIKVVTYQKEEYNASLIGFNSDADIAVLKIDKQLESMVLGDSDDVKVGDIVTAIGNPNGDLSFSKEEGKVLKVDQELLGKIDKERKYLWYDGNAISGYSGGAVYDSDGKVIGVLNAKYVGDLSKYDFDYLCQIIPINRVKVVVSDIIANK